MENTDNQPTGPSAATPTNTPGSTDALASPATAPVMSASASASTAPAAPATPSSAPVTSSAPAAPATALSVTPPSLAEEPATSTSVPTGPALAPAPGQSFSPSSTAETPAVSPAVAASAKPARKPLNKKVLIAAAVALVLIIGAVAYYALAGSSDSQSATNGPRNVVTKSAQLAATPATAEDVTETTTEIDSAIAETESIDEATSADLTDSALGLE